LRINSLYLGSRAFHAQQSSTQKKYIYKIHNAPVAHPFKLHYFFHVRQPLDLNLLNKLASYLIKTQDFKSFQSVGTDVENTVRTIFECHWTKNHDDLTFHIVGDGFLKQMVRNIVGTMVWCAQQKDGEAQFVNIIDSLDRRKAKVPAPAHGLFLKWVRYPQKLLTSLQKLEN
jgi:tRNA pseudouridine38-40 synthase